MIQEHLAHLRHLGRRPGTIAQRGWCLGRLEQHLGHDLLDATSAELLDFVSRGTHRGAEYRCAEISHVRGYYAWATVQGWLETDPAVRLARPRRLRHLPRPMPDADLRTALTTAPEPIRTWIALAAYAGLRCCEIAPLRGDDYHRGRFVLVVREQKGGDPGIVSVGPALAEVLAGLPPSGWWFPRWDGGDGPISAGQLGRHANRWLHDAGISHTMHTGRHWYGTCIQRAGHDIRITQEALRHRSLAATAVYTLVEDSAVARAVAAIPRMG